LTVSQKNQFLRLVALLAIAAAAVSLSGCSLTARKVLPGVTQDELSAGQEPYFDVGGITYQIQESRQLNPFSDDVEYFAGLKDAQKIPGNEFWYAVFIWAKNQNKQRLTTASKFILTDSAGNSYQPTHLNPSVNPWGCYPTQLAQNDINPNPDSIAASGTSGGCMVLFRVPESVYSNRPLTLHLYAQGASKAAAVDLDL
jgi:hypothetical protein